MEANKENTQFGFPRGSCQVQGAPFTRRRPPDEGQPTMRAGEMENEGSSGEALMIDISKMEPVIIKLMEFPKCRPWDIVKSRRFPCCHNPVENGHHKYCNEVFRFSTITIPKLIEVRLREYN